MFLFVSHYYLRVSSYLYSNVESSTFILLQLTYQNACMQTLYFYTMLCMELLTVTAEKETKHIAANRKKNIPPSVGFSDSSSSRIYLQESNVCYPKQIYGR